MYDEGTMICSSSCQAWCAKHGKSTGLFILRLVVGVIFISAGWGKLNGGIPMVTNMVDGLGFPLPAFFAWLIALIEFIGGIALVLGVAVSTCASLLAVIMLVAFFGAHGASIKAGGLAFSLLGSTLALAFVGGGSWSVLCWMCKEGKGFLGSECCKQEHGKHGEGCCKK